MDTFDEMKIVSANPHSYWALMVAGIRIILDLPNVSAGTGSSDAISLSQFSSCIAVSKMVLRSK